MLNRSGAFGALCYQERRFWCNVLAGTGENVENVAKTSIVKAITAVVVHYMYVHVGRVYMYVVVTKNNGRAG